MQMLVNIPRAVEEAATLKAARTGKSIERVLKDEFDRIVSLLEEQDLTYQQIAQMDECHVVTVKRRAKAGSYGRLIRKNRKEVRVSLKGYLKWKRGRS